MNNECGLTVFALGIYRLVIFPQVLGYFEVVVIDFFVQVKYGSNSSIAILAKTIRLLNYYRCNKEKRFTRCAQLLYIWIRNHVPYENVVFTKPYFLGVLPINEFYKNKWPELRIE